MKLWVDDEREPPVGWGWVKNARGAKVVIESLTVEEISLDHDMPDCGHTGCPIDSGKCDCPTGYDVALFIEDRAAKGIKPPKWKVHSKNPNGAYKIKQALTQADKVWVRVMSGRER